MDSDICQNIITRPRLHLGLISYSGYCPRPWAITTTYYICLPQINNDYTYICMVHCCVTASEHPGLPIHKAHFTVHSQWSTQCWWQWTMIKYNMATSHLHGQQASLHDYSIEIYIYIPWEMMTYDSEECYYPSFSLWLSTLANLVHSAAPIQTKMTLQI